MFLAVGQALGTQENTENVGSGLVFTQVMV